MILWRICLKNKKINAKLIVSDFDGTLKHSTNSVTKRNASAIEQFIAKNGKFAIATARPVYGLLPFLQNIPRVHYYILCNGAQILDQTQNEIYADFIDKQALQFLIQKFWDDKEIYFLFIGKQFSYTNNFLDTPPFSEYQKILRSKLISKDKIMQLDLKILNIEVLSSQKKLNLINREVQQFHRTLVSRLSWSNFIEIYSSKTSKGKALEKVQTLLSINKSETVAFGDANNDIELFRQSGTAVAMGNATDKLKAKADFITKNYTEDGVAVFIEKYIL